MKNYTKSKNPILLAGLAILAAGCVETGRTQVVLNSGNNYTYQMSLLDLSSGGDQPWVDNSTLPGWYYSPNATNLILTNGGNPTPGLQLYVNPVDSDARALGSLTDFSLNSLYYGLQVTNGGSDVLTEFTISFYQVQWYGGNDAVNDTKPFAYSTDATSLTTGTWNSFTTLNLTGFSNGDGGIAPIVVFRSATITGLSIEQGESVWLRWYDGDAIDGGDAGAGVTDLSVIAVPEPGVSVLAGFSLGFFLLSRRIRNKRDASRSV